MINWPHAVKELLRHEGGYVNDPDDPGGETKYGISKRSNPDLDIKNLTEEDATAIYHLSYWMKYGMDKIHDQDVATKVLLIFVVRNPKEAATIVQRACWAAAPTGLRPKIDGWMGPKTIKAINISDPKILIGALRAESAGHFRRLVEKRPELGKFLLGWLRRAYS